MGTWRYGNNRRSSATRGLTPQLMPPVCKYIILANIVVFVLQIFSVRHPQLGELPQPSPNAAERTLADEPAFLRYSLVEEWFQLDTDKVVFQGQVWRLITCAFCHDRWNVLHILFNMLMFYWFGRIVEIQYGSREFLLFYLTATLVASLSHVLLGLLTHTNAPAIGASGAVMAVVMLYAMHYPHHRIYVFFLFPIEIRWLLLLYVIFDLHPVLLALAGTPLATGVAHAAHLGGLAFGFLYFKYDLRLETYWERRPRWNWSRWFGSRRHVRLYRESAEPEAAAQPDPQPDFPHDSQPDHEVLLDQVLEKLHTQGDLSLTDAERALLREAAERYRKRRES